MILILNKAFLSMDTLSTGSLHDISEILGFPRVWEPNSSFWEPNPKFWDSGINLIFLSRRQTPNYHSRIGKLVFNTSVYVPALRDLETPAFWEFPKSKFGNSQNFRILIFNSQIFRISNLRIEYGISLIFRLLQSNDFLR
jgi:hypothetical protein